MINGTTPRHVFNLPVEAESIEEIRITYSQNNKVLLAKKKKDCEISGKKVKCYLSQQETFIFSSEYPVVIQMRIKFTDGQVIASKEIEVPVERVLNREVL